MMKTKLPNSQWKMLCEKKEPKVMKTKLPQWKMLCASLGRKSAPASTWRWPSTTFLSTTTNIIIVTVVGIHHQSCQLHQLQWLHNSYNGQPQDCHSRQYYKSHHVQVCVDGSEEECSIRLDKVCPLNKTRLHEEWDKSEEIKTKDWIFLNVSVDNWEPL